MPVTIIHPPDCDCGRHADGPVCLDSGYTTVSWDAHGFHGTPCHRPSCEAGKRARDTGQRHSS